VTQLGFSKKATPKKNGRLGGCCGRGYLKNGEKRGGGNGHVRGGGHSRGSKHGAKGWSGSNLPYRGKSRTRFNGEKKGGLRKNTGESREEGGKYIRIKKGQSVEQ